MQQNYPVIICGAGPTGLMLAAQLLRFGIDFLIIDAKASPTKESRAVVIQARSLEIYEQMGLSDEILADGTKANGFCFWRGGKEIAEVKLSDFGENITPFDFVYLYEQSKNETLLYHHLQKNGREVMWNTQLVSYEEKENLYEVKIKSEAGEFTISSQYLIACDGAKSKLRELADMDFTGGTYQQVFYVADTHVHGNVCAGKLNFFVTKNTFHLLFPLEGEKRFRAIGILPEQFYHQDEIHFEEVSKQVETDAEMNLGFYDTQWYSTYRLHHKKIKAFSKGNLFFCGDAAHVHSPAGGQGMNTGLQDAHNLAWKLALVINKKAKPELLATYHEERNPVAEHLLLTTDRMFNVMANDSFANSLLRLYVFPALLPRLMKVKALRKQFFLLLSQTEIQYHSSSLSAGDAGNVKSGARLPYTTLYIDNEEISVYQFVRAKAKTPFLLLHFNSPADGFEETGLISRVEIENNSFNQNALKKAEFPSSFILLLRPDNYIGYLSERFEESEYDLYLEKHLFLF